MTARAAGLLLAGLLLLAGCGAPPAAGPAADTPPAAADRCLETETLTGLIETGSGKVYLVTEWQSRSRVSYEVVGGPIKALAARAGTVVTVEAVVLWREQWRGKIAVVEPRE